MSATLVPAEHLVPPEAYSRGFRGHDAALLIDGYLRRLASQDARCRLVLGRIAHAFLSGRAHNALGFARVDDYARERLGLSARTLESAAAVATRLATLPAATSAFEAGALTWAHVRLLARVATPETEARWLEAARGQTVRTLESLIRDQHRPDDEDGDDEPHVRMRIRCPRRTMRLWREVVELARRMAGAPLSDGAAAEAIAAEGLSARPATPATWPDGARPSESFADEPAPDLDWSAVAEAIPDDIAALADTDDADPIALDARLRKVVLAMQRSDWQIGRLLRIVFDRRLYLLMGFRSAARYVHERLGLSERKARALVALERQSWRAPALGEAYRAGTVSWLRALTVLPVASEKTAAAWVERAQEVTMRRLSDEIEWALASRIPCDAVAPPPPGAALDVERQMCAGPDFDFPDGEVAFSAPASVVAVFRAAVLAFTGPPEALWRGFEHLLEHVKAEWTSQPRHRDPIFARDGWRCAVPTCSSRKQLHDHHIVFRSRGGDNGRDNRITICAWHHLRGIHGGIVRASGEAPAGITWELGVRAGRRPLLRLHGDRYLH